MKPVFEIKNVTIERASPKLEKSIANLKNTIIGKNVNELDLDELRDRLLEDVRVEKATVERKNINEISIKVVERQPSYYFQYNKRVYLLDKDGKVYGYIDDVPLKDFPFIVAKSEDDIKTMIGVLDKIEETDLGDIISQIYIKDKKLIEIVLYDSTIIKTDEDVTKDKYRIGSYLYFDLSNKKKIEYIDFRYRDYIIKYKDETTKKIRK